MPPNDARSPKASSQAARLEPRWHGSTMSAHRLCHGSFPLIGPDWLILTTQSDDRIRPFCRPSPPLAAIPALAPHLPFAIPAGIGSIGRKAGLDRTAGTGAIADVQGRRRAPRVRPKLTLPFCKSPCDV